MPNPSGVNRRRKPARRGRAKQPRFLRKVIADRGSNVPARVLRILAWTIAFWFVVGVLMGDTGLFSILGLRSMKSQLEDEIRILEDVKAEVIQRRDNLESDPWTIETVAREEYGMIKDGEIVYRLSAEATEDD